MPHLSCLLSSLALLLLAAAGARAEGTVTHLAGMLSAQKADGAIKVLGPQSTVQSGDVLRTEKDAYAQVKFSDGGVVTLKPNTQIKIDAYVFDQAKPEQDNVVFSLVKGGLRAITGLIGKRGNQDAWRLATPTATIGIRGTTIDAQHVPEGEGSVSGTFLSVSSGEAFMQTQAGLQIFQSGQSGYAGSPNQAPVMLPSTPNQTQFTPPASFESNQPSACVVR